MNIYWIDCCSNFQKGHDMRTRLYIILIFILMLAFSCSKDDTVTEPEIQGDFSLKTYALERSPKINRTGAGLDFVHNGEYADTTYFGDSTPEAFVADAVFYNLMVYFEDEKGDTQSEGSPAILLAEEARAMLAGTGIDYFNSFTEITSAMLDSLASDITIDFNSCVNDSGFYDKSLIMAAYDGCVIGNKFRTRIISIPEDQNEEDLQPVFLVQTVEGSFVKFMVTQFKGSGENKQKTTVMWQLLEL